MTDPIALFGEHFERAKAREPFEPNAMTLATVSRDGAPAARVVLLKGVEHGGFVFYTNYRSRKAREIGERAQACLVFLWSDLERQVRITGRVAQYQPTESASIVGERRSAGRATPTWARRRAVWCAIRP